jgi:hypothetical protein
MLLASWIPQYLALDAIFRTIAVKRRRALLYRLLAGPERQSVALDELISFVAVWEALHEPRAGRKQLGPTSIDATSQQACSTGTSRI